MAFKKFSVERGGFVTVKDVAVSLVRDLTEFYAGDNDNAFSIIHPSASTMNLSTPSTITTDNIVIQATGNVDALAGVDPITNRIPQAWVIRLDWGVGKLTNEPDEDSGILHINVTTPLQLDQDSFEAYHFISPDQSGDSPYIKGTLGFLGERIRIDAGVTVTEAEKTRIEDSGFLCRRHYLQTSSQFQSQLSANNIATNIGHNGFNVPMSYALTVSEHGIAFAVWEEACDQYDYSGHRFSWFSVQRLVNKKTGEPLVNQGESHCPLVCLFSIYNDRLRHNRYFVVRESDIHRPSEDLDSTANTTDSNSLINNFEQVATTEDYEYIITIPSGITTQRYLYLEEMDLIGFTSADVISEDGIAELSMYEEGTFAGEVKRYKGLHSNGKYNTGMRPVIRWFHEATCTQDQIGVSKLSPAEYDQLEAFKTVLAAGETLSEVEMELYDTLILKEQS